MPPGQQGRSTQGGNTAPSPPPATGVIGQTADSAKADSQFQSSGPIRSIPVQTNPAPPPSQGNAGQPPPAVGQFPGPQGETPNQGDGGSWMPPGQQGRDSGNWMPPGQQGRDNGTWTPPGQQGGDGGNWMPPGQQGRDNGTWALQSQPASPENRDSGDGAFGSPGFQGDNGAWVPPGQQGRDNGTWVPPGQQGRDNGTWVPPGQQGRDNGSWTPPGLQGRDGGQATQFGSNAPPSTGQPSNAFTPPPALGTPLTEIPRADVPVQDGYRAQFRSPTTEVAIQGQPIETPVDALVPSLKDTKTLGDVEERFANDYQVLKNQVDELPSLSDPEKADRAFEFFEKYAGRFVALATGDAQGSAFPRDPSLKQPVTGASQEGAHLLGEDAAPTDEMAAQQDPAGKPRAQGDGGKAGKGGLSKLDRLLMGDVPEEPQAGKKDQGTGGRPGRAMTGELRMMEQELAAGRQQPRPGQAEIQKQAKSFTELLQSLDFDQMHDVSSGKDGVQLAYEMLTARSKAEFEKLAQRREMTAEQWPPRAPEEPETQLPPEQYHPATMGREPAQRLKELGESRPELDGRFERERVTGQPERTRVQSGLEQNRPLVALLERSPRDARRVDLASNMGDVFGRMGRRLGSNHLWNVLHGLRTLGPDSAVEKEKFDQLAFGAICLLCLLALGVIILANL